MGDKDIKRTAFDLTTENSAKLKDFSSKMGSNFSRVMNYMLRIMLGAHPEVKQSIAEFCNSKIQDIDSEMKNMSEFEKQDEIQKKRQYQEMAYFFSVDLDAIQTRKNNMRKVYLKEGYLLIPSDESWVILDNLSNPAECMYAGVVETREPLDGKKKYHAKHYIFFSNYQYGKDYPSNYEDEIYEACCEKDPAFKEILNAVVEPSYDGREILQNMTNLDAYKASPVPGLFHIVVKGDPTYWNDANPDYKPPFGAVIIR